MAKQKGIRSTRVNGPREEDQRYELAPGEHLRSVTGFDDPSLQLRYLNQLIATVQTMEGETTEDRIGTLIAALKDIAPRDGVEGMLAAQMVATHEHAMECFRRAMFPDQTIAGRDLNLKHATKLLQLYARQLEALDKHRGRGEQKIIVEHVTVQAGGQAIVGNVDAAAVDRTQPSELEHNSELGAPVPSTTPRRMAALTRGRGSTSEKKSGARE